MCRCVRVCLLKVSSAPPSWQILLALLTHSHQKHYTSLPPYCQHCVYVEADNTTGLNPSTCDFLQTGLVPVFPLNSPWNAGKSRAAGWSTGRGPDSLFHVVNTLLVLSKWTALLWMWSTSIPCLQNSFSMQPRGQKSKAACMTSERPAVRKKNMHLVLFHTQTNKDTPEISLKQSAGETSYSWTTTNTQPVSLTFWK